MLLDHELRARYANPALHAMFKSPQKFVDSKPLYADMLKHARRSSAYAVSPDELKRYVAERLAWVVAGDRLVRVAWKSRMQPQTREPTPASPASRAKTMAISEKRCRRG